jgi:hypothetical protein
MKKIISILLFVVVTIGSMAQVTEPANKKINEDLLRKSKNQKTTGIIMAAGGTTLLLIGLAVASNSRDLDDLDQVVEGAGLMVLGSAGMLGSIPFFISSGKNKRKAMEMSAGIKFERNSVKGMSINSPNSYPVAMVRISIK